MGERLCGGNVAIALLANTIATGAGLVALILTFGPISGAHFNPAVTLADATQGGLPWKEVPAYVIAQVVGAFAGVAVAHIMFGERVFSASQHVRSGLPQLVSELVATFGLLSVIWGCGRRSSAAAPFAIGAYIVAAYWFTSSTSLANPAMTLARAASDTFAGLRRSVSRRPWAPSRRLAARRSEGQAGRAGAPDPRRGSLEGHVVDRDRGVGQLGPFTWRVLRCPRSPACGASSSRVDPRSGSRASGRRAARTRGYTP